MEPKLTLKIEYLSKRCEVCHQADQFDPITNFCKRCSASLAKEQKEQLEFPAVVRQYNMAFGFNSEKERIYTNPIVEEWMPGERIKLVKKEAPKFSLCLFGASIIASICFLPIYASISMAFGLSNSAIFLIGSTFALTFAFVAFCLSERRKEIVLDWPRATLTQTSYRLLKSCKQYQLESLLRIEIVQPQATTYQLSFVFPQSKLSFAGSDKSDMAILQNFAELMAQILLVPLTINTQTIFLPER
ncbi:MAG: hypothetical protein JNN15_05025 [Blastocatellia bacterium]|nr:hypothetical protein [Blastocatellia bacterium]